MVPSAGTDGTTDAVTVKSTKLNVAVAVCTSDPLVPVMVTMYVAAMVA